MKFNHFLAAMILSFVPGLAHADDAKQPITQDEVQTILHAGFTADVLNSVKGMEAYTRQYYAQNVRVRSVDEVHLPNNAPVQTSEQVYDGLDAMIAMVRKTVPSGDMIFIEAPKVSSEKVISFSYDEQKGQADVVYQVIVEGIPVAAPRFQTKTEQVCRSVAERQGEKKEIKLILGACRQKIIITPIASM